MNIDIDNFSSAYGCAYCQNEQYHDGFSNNDILIKDLAVLSGGGGTVTSAAIGINNAAELIHGFEWGLGGGAAVNLTYSFVTSTPRLRTHKFFK